MLFSAWQWQSQKGISSVDNLLLSPTFTSCPSFFLLCVILSHSVRIALILSPLIQCSSLFIFYSCRLLYNSCLSESTAIHATLTNNLMESDWIFNKEEKWWQKQTRLHKWVTALAIAFTLVEAETFQADLRPVLLLVIRIYIMFRITRQPQPWVWGRERKPVYLTMLQ